MVFNVLKGAYPGMKQVDRTLPVKAGEGDIERGALLYDDGSKFRLTTASQAGSATSPGKVVYFALQDPKDPTSGMAGNVGAGAVASASAEPVIAALSCISPCEVETDMYNSDETYSPGDLLSAGAGVVTKHENGNTVIGIVTRSIGAYWANNATAVEGYRTGAPAKVIQFHTTYLPGVATA